LKRQKRTLKGAWLILPLLLSAFLVLGPLPARATSGPTQCVVNSGSAQQTQSFNMPSDGTQAISISRSGCTSAGIVLVAYIYYALGEITGIKDDSGDHFGTDVSANYLSCRDYASGIGTCSAANTYSAIMDMYSANLSASEASMTITLTGLSGTLGVLTWEFWENIALTPYSTCTQGTAWSADDPGVPVFGGSFSCTAYLPAGGVAISGRLYTASGSGPPTYTSPGSQSYPANNGQGLDISNKVCSDGSYEENVCQSGMGYYVNAGSAKYYASGLGVTSETTLQSAYTFVATFKGYTSPAQAFTVIITNMDLTNYLLPTGKFYDFQATVSSYYITGIQNASPVDSVTVSWNDSSTVVTATYDNDTGYFTLDSGSAIATLRPGNVSTTVNKGYLTLNVNFLFSLSSNVLDANDRGIYLAATSGSISVGPVQVQSDYFNILNKGGGLSVLSAGDCSIPAAASVFETQCQYGDDAQNWIAENTTYYQLESYQGQFGIQLNNASDTSQQVPGFWQDYAASGSGTNPSSNKGDWTINMGFYSWDNDSQAWVKGINFVIEMEKGAVGSTNLWTEFQVAWYDGTTLMSNETFIGFVPNDTNNGIVNLWVNLWYSQNNASTEEGGQVSAYYTGMHNTNYLVWSSWSPFLGNDTAAPAYVPLKNADGGLMSAVNTQYSTVFYNMSRPGAPDQHTNQGNFQIKTVGTTISEFATASTGLMGGIATPVFAPAIVPILSSSSIFSPIINAIKAIAADIAKALLAVGTYVWNALAAQFPWLTGTISAFAGLVVGLADLAYSVGTDLARVLSFIYSNVSLVAWPIKVVIGAWNYIQSTYNTVFSGAQIGEMAEIIVLLLFASAVGAAINSDDPTQKFIDMARGAWNVTHAIFDFLWQIALFFVSMIEDVIP
jgi:phage baseplate assembly protein gpV